MNRLDSIKENAVKAGGKTTGSRIKHLRERKGWTQLELSLKVEMNNSVLSRIESNKRPVESEELRKFAEVFEVTTDYLIGKPESLIKESRTGSDEQVLHLIQRLERYEKALQHIADRDNCWDDLPEVAEKALKE